MQAFVTGGTGFIGKHVVQRLVARGYDVTCLVRRPARAADLRELGVTLLQGDITERESMREGMTGADLVLHIAGWYEVGLPPGAGERMERINVHGTENVLGLAVELNVPKIVYTSTAGVLGDTHGLVVDETYRRDCPFISIYDRTKYQAHQVAERYIAAGAPVVIVMPGGVYGPGDQSMVSTFLRLVLRRLLPIVPGAETGFSFAHVEDVAEGHVLAAEKGQVGQAYLLGGDVMTIGHAIQTVARLAGVPTPLFFTSSKPLALLEPLANRLETYVTLPPLLSAELVRQLGVTWMFSSAKAERELGYTHRSFEEGIAGTIEFEMAHYHSQPAFVLPRQQAGTLLALAAAAFTLMVLLRWRRRDTQ